MKRDLTKIYKNLDTHKKAALVFQGEITGDVQACHDIQRSVSKKVYSMPDVEFSDTLAAFHDVAAIWSIEYWRFCTKYVSIICKNLTGSVEVEKLDRLESFYLNRLIALGILSRTFTKRYGMDSGLLYRFANSSIEWDEGKGLEDLDSGSKDYYRNHLELFSSIVDGADPSSHVREYFGCPVE